MLENLSFYLGLIIVIVLLIMLEKKNKRCLPDIVGFSGTFN